MIGINEIKGVTISTAIDFSKDIGMDYYQNLEFPSKYPALITIHKEKPAIPTPLHWHPGGEIIYSKNWNLVVTVNGMQHMLHPGEFILISPYALHAIQPEQRSDEMQVLSITLDEKNLVGISSDVQFCEISREAPGVTAEMTENMFSLCEKLYAQIEADGKKNAFLINSVLFEMIQTILDNFWVKDVTGPRRVSGRENKLKSVLAYIGENYKENLSTQSVAEHFGYNREYFCRIFKKYSNTTFKEYLTDIRINAVVDQMRRSEESCAQIAMEQGFPDLKGFNSAFKKRFGMSPNQYRKEYIKKNQ